MQVCCPVCDTPFPLAAGFSEADGKRLAALLAEFEPALGRATIGYLALFKPAKTALRIARAAKLVGELQQLVAAGAVCKDERGGVRRPASPATWAAGIEQMLAQRASLSLPLDGHNYLRAVVFGLADKADAVAERQREADLQQGRRRGEPQALPNPVQHAFTDEMATISHDLHYDQITPEEADRRRAACRLKYGVKG